MEEHLDLIRHSEAILEPLAKDQRVVRASGPVLQHRNLNQSNVFVNPDDRTEITSVMGWQFTAVEPMHVHSGKTPDLCARPLVPMDELVGRAKRVSKEAKTKMAMLDEEVNKPGKIWELVLAVWAPGIMEARSLDEALTKPFMYAGNSWGIGAALSRYAFAELARKW